MVDFTVILAFISLLLSIIAIFITFFALLYVKDMLKYCIEAKIEVEAMKKSTHTVQYIDPEIDKLNAEFLREKEKRQKLKNQAQDALDKAVNPDEELFGF